MPFFIDCNHQVASMLRQNRFLEKLLQTLDTDPAKVRMRVAQLLQLTYMYFYRGVLILLQTCGSTFVIQKIGTDIFHVTKKKKKNVIFLYLH